MQVAVLCPPAPDQPPPANRQAAPCCALEVPDRAAPTAAYTEGLLALGRWERDHRPAPQGRCGFLSRCLGWPPPWVQSSSEALVKAKRHQSARGFLGPGATEDCGDPRAHICMDRRHALGRPTWFTQARPCSLPRPVSMATSLCQRPERVRPHSGMGAKGAELPVLAASFTQQPGQLPRRLEGLAGGSQAGPCSDGPGLGCHSRAPAEVSGTEVPPGRRDWAPRLHAPPCTPTGTPWRGGSGS